MMSGAIFVIKSISLFSIKGLWQHPNIVKSNPDEKVVERSK